MSGQGETEQTDADLSGSCGYGLGAREHGGAGGDDIVDEQDVAALQLLWISHGENALHVGPASLVV